MTETRTAIRTARELLGDGEPARADGLMREVLGREPDNAEARYTLAVSLRHRHRWSEALASLDRVLPGFVLRVRYEDVVAGLDGQVRRLLEFCRLPFEPACLEFHSTERSIRTPSAEQVRRPIYRSDSRNGATANRGSNR